MARKRISSSDLIWLFHERLKVYNPWCCARDRRGNGNWDVVTQRRLPGREPDLAKRISAIERELRKQYTLAAD
jgi:hypothetical protein